MREAMMRVGALALMMGCGSDEPEEGTATDGLGPDDVCGAEVACTGAEAQACEAVRQAERDQASAAGCDDELTLWWSCLLQNATCDAGVWSAATCSAEETAATVCVEGAPSTTPITVTDPPVVQSLQVVCPVDSSDTVRLTVVAPGLDGVEVIVDVVSTGEPSHRYEAHRLPRVSEGRYEVLLDTDLSYADGQASSMSCIKGIHYNRSDVMTYVVRAYDPLGLADCVADGHDPAGVLAGDYLDLGNGIDGGNVSDLVCEVAPL